MHLSEINAAGEEMATLMVVFNVANAHRVAARPRANVADARRAMWPGALYRDAHNSPAGLAHRLEAIWTAAWQNVPLNNGYLKSLECPSSSKIRSR